jgi:NTP pyrophosphatase (non-canonical NTP hydrolase)
MTHKEYLNNCLKTFKEDDLMSQVDHCKFGIIGEIGEITEWYKKIYGYKKDKTEEWKTEIKGEFGDLLYYLTVASNLFNAEGIVPYLDGVHTKRDNDNTELYIITQMLEDANKVALSSIHNPYLDSLICNILVNLRVLINREGFSLFEVMESNIKKLEVRHGEGFKQEATEEINRDREKEALAIK